MKNHITMDLPAHWASFLINDDATGLTEQDINQIDKELKGFSCLSVSDSSFYGQYNGIGYELLTYTLARWKTCDQCTAMVINGVFCHEHGCPNEKKTWVDGEWIRFVKCFECGYEVKEGENCDCHE